MKKLMTALLCALGFSLVSQAEWIRSGTNFEGLSVDFEVIGKTDDGSLDGGYWSNTVESVEALVATNTFTAVEVIPEEGESYTNYVPNIAPYTGDKGYPTVHGENESEKYLSINTKGGELVRNIQEGGTAQEIGDGIYFDTMVQFTATDALDANASNQSDKLILWLRDNGNGTTNLVVTAGYLNNEFGVVKTDYTIVNDVQADKWYRLTIQAITNAISFGQYQYVGYAVYIDGVKAEFATTTDAFTSNYTVSSPYSNYLYNENVHALFPSLVGYGLEGAETFTAVAFSGVGAVDDIEFTRTAPDFANPPASLTVEWDVGVDTVTITPDEGEAIVIAANGVAGSTNITDKGTYTIAATVQTGYVAATVSPAKVTVANTEVTVNVETEEGYADINGTLYASLADAVAAAQNGDTVKLYRGKDLGDATLAINSQNEFVLDLNGQVLSGSSGNGVLSVGSTLTIIDSVGGGAISNTTAEAEAVAVLVDGGSLVIGLDDNDMGASFFGAVGDANDNPDTISIVRGKFSSAPAAGYIAEGSYQKEELEDGLYVVEPGTPVNNVAEVNGQGYETLAEAVAAVESAGDAYTTVTILRDVTLDAKLEVAAKKVDFEAASPVVVSGQLRVVDGASVKIGQNVKFTSAAHPTVFILGDVSVKPYTAGTAPSTLVVDGVVENTNSGFDQTFAISGNGLDSQGSTITVNGMVTNANGIAIYNPQPGSLTINGTVAGASAISIKDGTLTVNNGAVVAATLANGVAYVGNNNGESPTGDAIIAPYYPAANGYGTPRVSVHGGTITVADTVNCSAIEAYDFNGVEAPEDAESNVNVDGGTFNTEVKDDYCANGFIPADNGDGTYGVELGWKIAFVNDDDTLIYATNVQANATVEYLGETPTKAADAEYTYTFKGWTPALAAATADATYKATYDATPVTTPSPTVDGKDVDADKVFDNATSASAIVYPTEPTKTKNQDGTTTVTFNDKSSTVPAYYDVTITQTQEATTYTVALKLNNTALPEIDEAVIDEQTKPAMEVTDGTTTVTLKATKAKLYYGLATADAPNANFTPPAPTTLTKGNGSAMQITIPVDSTETSKFYKVYVTDIAPPQSGN